MLLDDGYTRVLNATAALGNGSLEIWRETFTKRQLLAHQNFSPPTATSPSTLTSHPLRFAG